jgi:hypothetical protein
MARQNINFGVNPNDGTGDTLRNAMDKINDNFLELYNSDSQSIVIGNSNIRNTTIDGNISLDVSGTGTVQTSQGLLVNTGHQNSNSVFYALDGNPLLTVDVQNKRIAVNKATPDTAFDVSGDASFSGNLSANASATLGSTDSDRVVLNAKVFGDIIPGNAGNIGESATPWSGLYAENIESTEITTANIAATRISATEFTGSLVGNLNTSNDIVINNGAFTTRINSETLASPRQINFPDRSGTVVTKNNGRMSGPYGTAPSALTGSATDRQGDVALDDDYVYYCTADYDGSTQIWKKIALSASGITDTLTSISIASNTLSYVDEAGNTTDIDLSLYLDDTNLARIASGTLDGATGIATFSRDDSSTFDIDLSALLDTDTYINAAGFDTSTGIITLTNSDTSTVTANLDGRYLTDYTVTQSDVTTHQAALSITESQISDLQTYLTDYTVTESDVTAHQAALTITESQISDLGTYLTDYTVTESDVTAHQAALSITESQISDLGNYLNYGSQGVPLTSVGVSGDTQGDIAFDNDYMYYCTADYDGIANIWKRTALSTW